LKCQEINGQEGQKERRIKGRKTEGREARR
jgi:hypothetical protein